MVLFIFAPLFGAVLTRVIMRGLRGTSEVTKIVVPVGVMLGFLALADVDLEPAAEHAALVSEFFGADTSVTHRRHQRHATTSSSPSSWPSPSPSASRFLFYRTRTGVAMRAVVDDRRCCSSTAAGPSGLAMLSLGLGARSPRSPASSSRRSRAAR